MKYPIIYFVKNSMDYELSYNPSLIFKEGIPFLKNREYTVIDSELNQFVFNNYKVKNKISIFDQRRIKVFFQPIYELSYEITFKRKITFEDCNKLIIKIIKANKIYFEDIDVDGNKLFEKILNSQDIDSYVSNLIELAKIISSRR